MIFLKESATIYSTLALGLALFGGSCYVLNSIKPECDNEALQTGARGLLVCSSILVTLLICFLMCYHICKSNDPENRVANPTTWIFLLSFCVLICCLVFISMILYNVNKECAGENAETISGGMGISAAITTGVFIMINLAWLIHRAKIATLPAREKRAEYNAEQTKVYNNKRKKEDAIRKKHEKVIGDLEEKNRLDAIREQNEKEREAILKENQKKKARKEAELLRRRGEIENENARLSDEEAELLGVKELTAAQEAEENDRKNRLAKKSQIDKFVGQVRTGKRVPKNSESENSIDTAVTPNSKKTRPNNKMSGIKRKQGNKRLTPLSEEENPFNIDLADEKLDFGDGIRFNPGPDIRNTDDVKRRISPIVERHRIDEKDDDDNGTPSNTSENMNSDNDEEEKSNVPLNRQKKKNQPRPRTLAERINDLPTGGAVSLIVGNPK